LSSNRGKTINFFVPRPETVAVSFRVAPNFATEGGGVRFVDRKGGVVSLHARHRRPGGGWVELMDGWESMEVSAKRSTDGASNIQPPPSRRPWTSAWVRSGAAGDRAGGVPVPFGAEGLRRVMAVRDLLGSVLLGQYVNPLDGLAIAVNALVPARQAFSRACCQRGELP
jgi:hypothetical protein